MKRNVLAGMRILLGLIFLIFGANGLAMALTGSGFIPMPLPPPDSAMGALMGALALFKYLMPLVASIQTIAGALLLANFLTRFALVILAPVVVNILAIHLFIDQEGLPIAIVVTALTVGLILSDWDGYKSIFGKRKN